MDAWRSGFDVGAVFPTSIMKRIQYGITKKEGKPDELLSRDLHLFSPGLEDGFETLFSVFLKPGHGYQLRHKRADI